MAINRWDEDIFNMVKDVPERNQGGINQPLIEPESQTLHPRVPGSSQYQAPGTTTGAGQYINELAGINFMLNQPEWLNEEEYAFMGTNLTEFQDYFSDMLDDWIYDYWLDTGMDTTFGSFFDSWYENETENPTYTDWYQWMNEGNDPSFPGTGGAMGGNNGR